tara:strand:- start:195 stop:422 length:228 start_codon:yes stop_codon:yes gene_type:complete
MTETQQLKDWNHQAQQLNSSSALTLKPHLYTKDELILEVQRLKALAAGLRIERDLARNDLQIIKKNIKRMVTICK